MRTIMSTWLKKWEPENELFWKTEGARTAWRVLWISTWSLIFSFATWFVISAVVVRLPFIGFKFDTMQLFWLAAMPGLAGGPILSFLFFFFFFFFFILFFFVGRGFALACGGVFFFFFFFFFFFLRKKKKKKNAFCPA